MCSKQKIRKIAWCLLLVAFISLIPSNTFKVLADSDILPPFPYDELQKIGENNYVLFKVHGLDQIDYVECILPEFRAIGNYTYLLPGLSYFHSVGWNLQINSIDYCFKNGQKVDYELSGLANATSSLVQIDNEDPNHSFWLEFVYCTSDVYGYNYDSFDNYKGYDIRLFKAQNFIIPPAATPTPTPDVQPSIKSWEDYPQLPSNFSNDTKCILKVHSDGINDGQLIGIAWQSGSGAFNYPNFYKDRSHYGYNSQASIQNAISINTWSNNWWFSVFSVNYNESTDSYSVGDTLKSASSYLNDGDTTWYTSYNFYWKGETVSSWSLLPSNSFVVTGDLARTAPTGNWFEILFTNHNYVPGTSDNPNLSPTPLPTTAPSPIPQPSTTPEPEDPDKNSSWGWGIVNTLKYIFIPDKNKLIRLEKTTQTKFQKFGGGYDDLKHVSGFEDPVRPQNVVMNWKPFGTDSAEQQQQITLVDFEQIDFYLFQTSSGMFICDCLKASFTFLMFGYLIHVIRKHFVIENNTSEESDGGGD